jgi:hypothetical protein
MVLLGFYLRACHCHSIAFFTSRQPVHFRHYQQRCWRPSSSLTNRSSIHQLLHLPLEPPCYVWPLCHLHLHKHLIPQIIDQGALGRGVILTVNNIEGLSPWNHLNRRSPDITIFCCHPMQIRPSCQIVRHHTTTSYAMCRRQGFSLLFWHCSSSVFSLLTGLMVLERNANTICEKGAGAVSMRASSSCL